MKKLYDYYITRNNINMKIFAWIKCQKIFLNPFFPIWDNVFQTFCTKFLSSFHMISLVQKSSCCLSGNHNPELQCVVVYTFCTGVTLELHFSQPIRMKYFFHIYYYNWKIWIMIYTAGNVGQHFKLKYLPTLHQCIHSWPINWQLVEYLLRSSQVLINYWLHVGISWCVSS